MNNTCAEIEGRYAITHSEDTRGLIFDHISNENLCSGLNYTPEYIIGGKLPVIEHPSAFPFYEPIETNEPEKVLHEQIKESKYRVVDAKEGTVLRLWWNASKWHVSTYKKIDASKSFWGCDISHYDFFKQALHSKLEEKVSWADSTEDFNIDTFTDKLNRDRVYSFLVTNSFENRIVSKYKNPEIYFIGEFDNKTFNFIDENTSNIPGLPEHKFEKIEDIPEFVINTNPESTQGVFIYIFEGKLKMLKLTNFKYALKARARANYFDLLERYLVLKQNNSSLLQEFIALYPERKKEFEIFDSELNSAAEIIHRDYIYRFIHKKNIIIHNSQYWVMQKLKEKYFKDHEKTTVETVKNIFKEISARRLISIVESMYQEPTKEKAQIKEKLIGGHLGGMSTIHHILLQKI